MSINDHQIGDHLYRYCVLKGVFDYVVKGIHQHETDTQLEVECQNCNHGRKCRVLIAEDDSGNLKTIRTLDEDSFERHSVFHEGDGYYYWPSKDQAARQGVAKMLGQKHSEVSDLRSKLEAAERRRDEFEVLMKELNVKCESE